MFRQNFDMTRGVYNCQTARFDGSARALTEDQLRSIAPSIFAVTAHESRSERFRPIPTIEVLRGLLAEGFSPVGAMQATTRDKDKRDYTKHLIRLRRLDDKVYSVGDTCFEILLKNANDGTAAYEIMSGLFRVQCQNSLVALQTSLASLKVRHSGDVAHKVIEGTFEVLDTAEATLAKPVAWQAITLDRGEQQAFAEAAHTLRFPDCEDIATAPVRPAQLLRPRRHDDVAPNLWTTFNVVQENAIRGGLRGVATNAETGTRRRMSTRQINGIDQNVGLNRALWTLTQRMAELKGVTA